MQRFLILIIALLPFQIALLPFGGFAPALSRVLILCAALVWLARALIHKKISYPPALTSPLLLTFFLLSAFASLLVASDGAWFARKFIFLCNYAILFALLITTCTQQCMRQALRALIASSTLATLCALILWSGQFLFGADAIVTLWRTFIAPLFFGSAVTDTLATYSSAYVNIAGTNYLRLSGFFPDPHVAAFFFEMLIPFAFALAYTATTRRARFFWSGATITLLVATLATFTRGAYVAIAAGALCAFLLWFVRASIRRNIHFSWRGSAVALFGTLTLMALIFLTPLGARISAIFTHDTSVSARLDIYTQALDTIRARPLLGVGLGNYPLTVNPHANYRDPYYAHNLYLDIAVEMGLLALFLFLALLCGALWRFLRSATPLSTAGAIALIIYMTHSLFDTALFSVHVLPLLFFILALSMYRKP